MIPLGEKISVVQFSSKIIKILLQVTPRISSSQSHFAVRVADEIKLFRLISFIFTAAKYISRNCEKWHWHGVRAQIIFYKRVYKLREFLKREQKRLLTTILPPPSIPAITNTLMVTHNTVSFSLCGFFCTRDAEVGAG